MLSGIERLDDLLGPQQSGLTATSLDQIQAAVRDMDLNTLAQSNGHFATIARDGHTVRLARTIGVPLRYFVAKMYHGPFLIASDRIDSLFAWCQEQKIGWQFDPAYTRMVPAHYLVEVDQVGCPDPAPRFHRFFHPAIGNGPEDLAEAGAAYVSAAYRALKSWLVQIPADASVALAFSGGIDSTSVLILACQALQEIDGDIHRLRAFTLDLGGGADAEQARSVVQALGLQDHWETVKARPEDVDLEEAVRVIEDYHPLDVECAAMELLLLRGIRERYPEIRHLLDGDGGDENLKSYPLEDSDLTLSSVLRNPLLYQEGWGVENMKHSQTYSGGLSRGYVRSYATAKWHGFETFSPYTVRSSIAAALAIPFEQVLNGSVEKLYRLKAEVVSTGIRAITDIDMPVHPKRRFQEGASTSYYSWRVSKAWCRQVFMRQWQDRLRGAWNPEAERMSGNVVPESVLSAALPE